MICNPINLPFTSRGHSTTGNLLPFTLFYLISRVHATLSIQPVAASLEVGLDNAMKNNSANGCGVGVFF